MIIILLFRQIVKRGQLRYLLGNTWEFEINAGGGLDSCSESSKTGLESTEV
jgi:hypothetical protein